MRLFPTVHATGDLPPAQRAHLELHGLAFVAADDDPDLVLVLPGTTPTGDTARTGVVVLATGSETPRGRPPARLPRDHRAHGRPAAERARPRRPHGGRPPRVDHRRGRCPCARPSTSTVPPPAPAYRHRQPGARPHRGAACRDERSRLLVLGIDALADPEVLLNAAIWAARPTAAAVDRRPSRRARVAPGVDPAEAGRHRAPGPAGQGRRPSRRPAARPAPRAGARHRPVRRRARARAAARRGLPRRRSAGT